MEMLTLDFFWIIFFFVYFSKLQNDKVLHGGDGTGRLEIKVTVGTIVSFLM